MMKELIEKIKKFLHIGKKQEVLALEKGSNENANVERSNKSFREIYKSPISEIDEAIKRYKDLYIERSKVVEEIYGINSCREYEQYYIDSAKREGLDGTINRLGVEGVFSEMYDNIHHALVRIYEQDNLILEPEKHNELLRMLEKSYCTSSTKTIKQGVIDDIKDMYEGKNRIFDENKIGQEELADKFMNSALKSILLEKRLRTELNSEMCGIRYALINSLDESYDLPEAIEGKYENIVEYKSREKEGIINRLNEVIEYGSKTPSEKKAIKAILVNNILEKTAMQDDLSISFEMIENIISEEVRMGDINPEGARYYQDWLKKVCKNIKIGSDRVSPNNKSNYRFLNFYKTKVKQENGKEIEKLEVGVLEGKRREKEQNTQETTQDKEPEDLE